MLSNKQLGKYFRLAAQLAELHGENSFRVSALQSTAFKIDRYPVQLSSLSPIEIESAEGLSKTAIKKVTTLLERNSFDELDEYLSKTPPGIVELLSVKGIGPKKVAQLWQMGIESVGELLYACNENRLIELPGFGKKTQEQIRHAIEYRRSSEGKHHYAAIEPIALQLLTDLKMVNEVKACSLTGEIRRKCEVLHGIDILAAAADTTTLMHWLNEHPLIDKDSARENKSHILATIGGNINLNIEITAEPDYMHRLFLTTGSDEHIKWYNSKNPSVEKRASEKDYYSAAGLPYFEPELREGIFEESLSKYAEIPQMITFADLKGALHNHTTYSDGTDSLETMVAYCKEIGLTYFGVCDHSKSAFYANGLTEDRVLVQHEHIDKLNAADKSFRIFKGIESDILSDGSLDYDETVLKTFDFVVASIHSNFRMDEEKATRRLIKAIENPYTDIIGHMTGRLLLARQGYPVNVLKVIDACAANRVAIELNANPYRLDMDWRFMRHAIEKGILISINPDAHRKEGLLDMHYGIAVARKAGLTASQTLNAMDLKEFTGWLES